MEIIVSNFAKKQLQDIYDFITLSASSNIADKEIERSIQFISYLETTPKIGREVEELKSLSLKHRQLVVSNYKIIYRIDNNIIYVTDIFDCRQHPNKIFKRNK